MSQQECCPDLGFLIVFPKYHAGGVPGSGHAAAVLVNGRTGELKGYDFGRDDHMHEEVRLGYVGRYGAVLTLKSACLPECGALSRVMYRVSEAFGVDGRHNLFASGDISGVLYRKPPGSYEKSVAYAEDRTRVNAEYQRRLRGEHIPEDKRLGEEYQYSLSSNNCMTFACSVLAGQPAGRKGVMDWPVNDIEMRQWLATTFGVGAKFSYSPKTGEIQCDGCCEKADSREYRPTPEQMGGIAIGGGLYYYEDPLSGF